MKLRSHSSPSERKSTAKKEAPSFRITTSSASSSSSSRRSAVSPRNTIPPPSSSTRQSAAERVVPSFIIKSGRNRPKPFTLSTWNWGKARRASPHSEGPRLLSSHSFADLLGNEGISSLTRTTSSMWPDESNDQVWKMPVPEEVRAEGVRLCTSSAAKFDAVEKIISIKRPVRVTSW